MNVPHREILWNVPSAVMAAVYLLSAIAFLWIVAWFVWRWRRWRKGQPDESRQRGIVAGLTELTTYLLTHRTIARERYAGWMHGLMFWGFVVLLIATTLVAIQHHGGVEFLTGTTYLVFSLSADLGGVAFCIGAALALWRRRSVASHGRLLPRRSTTAMLWLLLVLGLSGFLVEGLRIAHDVPGFERFSPVGWVTAHVVRFMGPSTDLMRALHLAAWVGHAALAIAFFVIVPITLLKHIVVAAYSVARSRVEPGLMAPSPRPVLGAAELSAFRRFDLVQADACLTCGLCHQVCPAQAAGKPLSPRSVVLGLRAFLDEPHRPATEHVSDGALWSCTTCLACDTACPVGIKIVDKIVTLRRGRVAEGVVPASAAEALESAAQRFNPFGRPNSARLEWAAGLDVPTAGEGETVELLYWVGCAGAFDPAGREVSRAMVRILNRTGVAYRVLGCRELCTGDPARRMGEEGLWHELAETNRRTILDHGVRTILTHCPHCVNSLAREYAELGPMPRVFHHTQWLAEQVAAGTLRLTASESEPIAFHDPCYLARAAGETSAPRIVLDAVAVDRREMAPHGSKTFCCGGGGGQLWLDVRGETRVENIRASHAAATGATTVATGCPFCRVMLEAGRTSLPSESAKWRVRDVAELVAERMEERR